MSFRLLLAIACLFAVLRGTLPAQVLTPMELSEPKTQRLQQLNMKALTAIASDIGKYKFPYPFYFSRTLDLDLAKAQTSDQRSIRFDVYKGQTVLEITGNYYASYSTDRMSPYDRLKETFLQVMLPILRTEVPHFPDDSEFSAFAIEVSHHVRQNALGVRSEWPENVTLIIPVPAAQQLIDAKTDEQRQAAVLEARVFLNGEPYVLWLQEGAPTEEWKEQALSAKKSFAEPSPGSNFNPGGKSGQAVSDHLVNASAAPLRIISPEVLGKLQYANQEQLRRITQELNTEAHFVPYAPASFVAFRHAAYLQLSVVTTLDVGEQASRYKLAALAFDDHVSHLVREVLHYFPSETDFDGISFSSVIHLTSAAAPLAVEFYFPVRAMRCFANYECTGQQLLDSGTVVINGERAALDLQIAEGKN